MKSNLPLLGLCINFFLLSLFVGRSVGGVANLCEKGKFFDRSRQEYLPCHECKSEIQECFTCCQSEAETQNDGRNAKNLNTSTTHPRGKDTPGAKETHLPSKIEASLPNILVVSTVSVFFVASLVVLLLVVIRSSCGRSDETNEGTSSSQRSEVVTEVMIMELRDEINDCDTVSDGNVHT